MIQNKKKFKVCIVTAILPPSYGGAEVAALKYAIRLNSREDSEAIIIGWDRNGSYETSNIKYDFIYPLKFHENSEEVKGLLIYYQQMYHIWKCFMALIYPMYKLRKRYDYIHNFNSGFAFNRVSIFIGKLLGKKVITETSLIGDDDPISLGRFRHWTDHLKPKHLRYIFYKMADRFISKSPVITEIYERSEIPIQKVIEIPYSVDINKFSPVDKVEQKKYRKKLDIWEDGTLILFVGGINIRKGVHLLVDAFIETYKSNPEIRLLIVGPTYKYDQKYIDDIKLKIANENLEDKVIFTENNINNVDEYMKSSDIFVLPSKQEGFPISIIESMSCGLTVIGSDIPEIAKAQIDNGIDGYTFPSGDSKKLSELIQSLLNRKSEMEMCGINARKKAVENWSDVIIDNQYRDLYLSMNSKTNFSKEKIKILYTIPNFNTAGSGKALLNVISRLDKDKFEPSICCRHEKGDLFNSAKELNIPIYISEFSTPMKPRLKGIEGVYKLSRFFNKIKPDIIHSYNYSDDYSEALAAKLSGIKWVYTKKNMSWGSNAWKLRTRLADFIITQNNEMVDVFFKGKNNCPLIPIGINPEEFSDLEKSEEVSEKYNLSGASPVILTIANIIPIKGIDFLIKGFELIEEDFKSPKLLIVGEDNTEYAKKLKLKIKEQNLEDKIIFTGRQNNVRSFFSVADIFILPSIKTGEGGPISILESMASGVLSYGSDVPGIRDQFKVLEDQLFEAENPGSIANKILHWASLNQEEIDERLKIQRDFINENYSLRNEITNLMKLYEDLYSNRNT